MAGKTLSFSCRSPFKRLHIGFWTKRLSSPSQSHNASRLVSRHCFSYLSLSDYHDLDQRFNRASRKCQISKKTGKTICRPGRQYNGRSCTASYLRWGLSSCCAGYQATNCEWGCRAVRFDRRVGRCFYSAQRSRSWPRAVSSAFTSMLLPVVDIR